MGDLKGLPSVTSVCISNKQNYHIKFTSTSYSFVFLCLVCLSLPQGFWCIYPLFKLFSNTTVVRQQQSHTLLRELQLQLFNY